MKGLYKGRYIIAIYDKNDYLIDVVCSPKELRDYKNKNSAKSAISHTLRRGSSSIHFIDVIEKQDDIFIEEDKLFIDFVKETYGEINKIKAKALGISERTYYRRKQFYGSNVTK